MCKSMLAIAAALALGTATMMTGAIAAPHGGGGGGGGFGGGGGGGVHAGGGGGAGFGGGGARFGGGGARFGGGGNFAAGPRFNGGGRFAAGPRFNGRFGFRGRRGRFFGPGIGLYAYGGWPWWGTGGCWVHRWVWTPFGWRWRVVDVC